MKRPKLVRDDSGEREGWWLGDRFVPDVPPEAGEWHAERKARAALEALAKRIREQYLRPWRQGAHNNLGCDCCGCSWDTEREEHHSTVCIVGMAREALNPQNGGGPSDG